MVGGFPKDPDELPSLVPRQALVACLPKFRCCLLATATLLMGKGHDKVMGAKRQNSNTYLCITVIGFDAPNVRYLLGIRPPIRL